jgi:phosphate transport system substrate-binding protein
MMKKTDTLSRISMGLMLAALLALVQAFTPGSVSAADTINGAGATFPYPVYSAWAFEYNKVTGTRLNYQSIGSGGGQRQIAGRTVDFGASDEPLTPEALAKDNLLQFPAVIGGVVPVINIRGVKPGALNLNAETICGIFLGDITTWNDPKIAKLNPSLNLPADGITVVHRSDGSGTTAIFTSYLGEVCPAWNERVGVGKAVKWLVGIGGKGNEGVSNYVQRSKNSIGYVEFAYAKQSKLTHANLMNQAGEFVEPSFASFQAAAAAADFNPERHFHLWLVNAPGKGSWPIAGATFILLAKESTAQNRKVVTFFNWAFENGDATAERLVYVPLPDELKARVRAYWKAHGIQ